MGAGTFLSSTVIAGIVVVVWLLRVTVRVAVFDEVVFQLFDATIKEFTIFSFTMNHTSLMITKEVAMGVGVCTRRALWVHFLVCWIRMCCVDILICVVLCCRRKEVCE